MYKNYSYLSGTSNTMKIYFNNFVQSLNLKNKKVLDIACNDCALLDSFKEFGNETYGIDPAENIVKNINNHNIYCGFFNKDAINYFKSKIKNPKFLIWSNDFSNLDKYFDNNFMFVQNSNKKKDLVDLYLLTKCKYFIVAPSTFSWWGAWLSKRKGKICVRPKNLNVSNNKDFWPENWNPIL